MGAQARQRNGVGADVALQVYTTFAPDVAEQRHIKAHDTTDEVGIGVKPVDRVVGRFRVGRRALLLTRLWLGFLVGALLSGVGTPRYGALVLSAPALILAALAAFDRPDSTTG